jgi:hypothetical protein
MTNAVPAGWHTVTPRIVVEDPAGSVAFLKRVFEAAGELQADARSRSSGSETDLRERRKAPRP